MCLYWTSVPHLEDGALSSSLAPLSGSFFLPDTVKQVFSITDFLTILQAEPLVQH